MINGMATIRNKRRNKFPIRCAALPTHRAQELPYSQKSSAVSACLAASFSTYEGVIDSLRNLLVREHQWLDDKAELLYSRHSPTSAGDEPSRRASTERLLRRDE